MKYVFAGGIVILVIFLGVLSQIPLGIEPLTEVYFEDHLGLPSVVKAGEIEEFYFTVNNLEYQDMRYWYNVSVFDVDGDFVKVVDYGSFDIGHNETWTLNERVLFDSDFGRERVEVMVKKDHKNIAPEFKTKLWWPDPNYPERIDIHFWVDEKE